MTLSEHFGRSSEGAGSQEEYLEQLLDALDLPWLKKLGWNPDSEEFRPPRDHPLLGVKKCIRIGCDASVVSKVGDFCDLCSIERKKQGLAEDEFAKIPRIYKNLRNSACAVPKCIRKRHDQKTGFCATHRRHFIASSSQSPRVWIRDGNPYVPDFQAVCMQTSCTFGAEGAHGLCATHLTRWTYYVRKHGVQNNEENRRSWAEHIAVNHQEFYVVLKGLNPVVKAEILLAIQIRTKAEKRTVLARLRHVERLARRWEISSIGQLQGYVTRTDVISFVNSIVTIIHQNISRFDTEIERDVWNLGIFGLSGRLDFRGITIYELREAAKFVCAHEIPLHRGRQRDVTAREWIRTLTLLTSSIVGSFSTPPRIDQLTRRHIDIYFAALSSLVARNEINESTRVRRIQFLRRFLEEVRALGLTRTGEILEGLDDTFHIKRGETPSRSRTNFSKFVIPSEIMEIVLQNIDTLETRSGSTTANALRVMIDTGRRPDEVLRLRWDCLFKNDSDQWSLEYDDTKNQRLNLRLPITKDTARVLMAQKDSVRKRFDTNTADLALFPREYGNLSGTRPMPAKSFTDAHRKFIDRIGHLLKTETGPYDPKRITPYCYRHTYTQRHADASVSPDVLRDLLGHRSMNTTMGYYVVTEKRVRDAVQRVAAHQVAPQVDLEPLIRVSPEDVSRNLVSQVAVPFGSCLEPSNVKALGQACPYKFTCLGCSHFRTDASYLPELKAYLDSLLSDRELYRSSNDLTSWAKKELDPSDEEIEVLRSLIRKIEGDVDQLSNEERTSLQTAIETLRQVRESTDLGMPSFKGNRVDGV